MGEINKLGYDSGKWVRCEKCNILFPKQLQDEYEKNGEVESDIIPIDFLLTTESGCPWCKYKDEKRLKKTIEFFQKNNC